MHIPYGRQTISSADIQAVVDVLKSDFLTQGPVVPKFEEMVANYCDVSHAVAVNSATSALHIACLALGVGPGDLVWTSPITFVASANCARYCGADIDFVDIDPLTFNMSPRCLAEKLAIAKANGRLPKVIIPVHMAGQPCDMSAISHLAHQYGISLIEDASHAIGARYLDSIIGDCKYSDITVFSFHPVKIITTAEGGMATTKSNQLARKLKLFRSHGITREGREMINVPDGPWYYEQQLLGYNYRMTELQAALGLSQMSHLDEWVRRRHILANRYDDGLAGLPLILPAYDGHALSALHLYIIQIDSNRTNVSRRILFDALLEADIGVNVHYIPVHLQPDFQKLGFFAGTFPCSENYYSRSISLPLYPGLSEFQQDYVIEKIKMIFL